MVLKLSPASSADVDQIASVHLAAFDSNALLHAQFPTQSSLKFLHSILRNKLSRYIQEGVQSDKAVLIVKDTEAKNRIISFATWDLPGQTDEGINLEAAWPEDCQKELLSSYYELAEAAKERVLRTLHVKKYYRLTFIGTLPEFQGKGAGTLLTEWGLHRSREENVPIYLESTIEASAFYRRLGFTALDGLSMKLPGNGHHDGPNIYEEVGMLRVWDEDIGMDYWDSSLNIRSLKLDYDAGIKPQHVIQAIFDRIEAYRALQPSVWIHLHPIGEVMRAANELYVRWPEVANRPSLWGIPFSVKDNIDVAEIPTTAGLPALAYVPTVSATALQKCIDAGGLFIGKTNMEQLATGMTGCRSPYGTLHSTFSKDHCVGGSSSGSAVTVSEQLVSFSLGSDTAGSIRVPALFNGVVGFKPTKGTVSATGVAPACLHQDCVSFIASDVEDVGTVWRACKGYDETDFFAKRPTAPRKPILTHFDKIATFEDHLVRPRLRCLIGTPPASIIEDCTDDYRRRFSACLEILRAVKDENETYAWNNEQIGSWSTELVDLDWIPFATANNLLYNGSFVQERLTILPDGWFEVNKHHLHPVTRQVFESAAAKCSSAVDVFRDLRTQAECKRIVEEMLTYKRHCEDGKDEFEFTVMLVPTAPFHPTIEEVEKDPIEINSKLGVFTHFANVLDLTAIAIPCGTYELDDQGIGGKKTRLPFGVTILASYELDAQLLDLAHMLEEKLQEIEEDVEEGKIN